MNSQVSPVHVDLPWIIIHGRINIRADTIFTLIDVSALYSLCSAMGIGFRSVRPENSAEEVNQDTARLCRRLKQDPQNDNSITISIYVSYLDLFLVAGPRQYESWSCIVSFPPKISSQFLSYLFVNKFGTEAVAI